MKLIQWKRREIMLSLVAAAKLKLDEWYVGGGDIMNIISG